MKIFIFNLSSKGWNFALYAFINFGEILSVKLNGLNLSSFNTIFLFSKFRNFPLNTFFHDGSDDIFL